MDCAHVHSQVQDRFRFFVIEKNLKETRKKFFFVSSFLQIFCNRNSQMVKKAGEKRGHPENDPHHVKLNFVQNRNRHDVVATTRTTNAKQSSQKDSLASTKEKSQSLTVQSFLTPKLPKNAPPVAIALPPPRQTKSKQINRPPSPLPPPPSKSDIVQNRPNLQNSTVVNRVLERLICMDLD
jgi:hypothetical protein